jgi:hypothetical protein
MVVTEDFLSIPTSTLLKNPRDFSI